MIEVDGAVASCVALRPAKDTYWLEHFYLDPDLQGKGIGTAVLSRLLEWCNLEDAVVRLNVLQGSSARRLYERHGFTAETEDEVDVFMARHSSSSGDHPVETRPGGSSSRRTASRSQGAVTVPSGFRGLVHESSWFRTPAPRHRA